MPGNERRRQKALARKAERRKKKSTRHQPARAVPGLRDAARWPLYECQLSRSWREPGQIVQILVARSAGAEIAVAGFLVDLGCLGVKDALTHVLSPVEYEGFRRSFTSRQPMVRADLNLVAKIIQVGSAYAERLGFEPHPDYRDAALLLAGADPAACATSIPLGLDGKPLLVPGPFDNVPRIVRQLERAVGPGNFHYVLELDDQFDTAGGDTQGQVREERPASFLLRLLRRFHRG